MRVVLIFNLVSREPSPKQPLAIFIKMFRSQSICVILAEAGGLPQTQSLPRLHNRFCLGQTKPSLPPQRNSPTADSFGQDGPLSNQVIEIERGQKTLSGSTQVPYQT